MTYKNGLLALPGLLREPHFAFWVSYCIWLNVTVSLPNLPIICEHNRLYKDNKHRIAKLLKYLTHMLASHLGSTVERIITYFV